jgi:hypothetical protein|tara:strand:- start:206 stop:391 length:186 start_codon:yes stop_codon:yes gene_type:complete
MKEGSDHSKKKQIQREVRRKKWWWALGISFALTIIPPHFGAPFFILLSIGVCYYACREWMG